MDLIDKLYEEYKEQLKKYQKRHQEAATIYNISIKPTYRKHVVIKDLIKNTEHFKKKFIKYIISQLILHDMDIYDKEFFTEERELTGDQVNEPTNE